MAKTITAEQTMLQSQTVKKFWNVANIDGKNAEIVFYGEICSEKPRDWWTGEVIEGLYITPEGFLEDLQTIKNAKNITVKLNSIGGDLYTSLAIHNALKALKAKITVIVEGIAASGASIIMCAGDKVIVRAGSLVMIHGVAGLFCETLTIEDLEKALRGFEASESAIAEIYSQKTGMSTDELRSMMKAETWMTGKQAVEKGFADELAEDESAEVNMVDKSVLMVNGLRFNLAGHSIPKELIMQNVVTKEKIGGFKKMSKLQEFLAGMTNLATKLTDAEGEGKEKEKEPENSEDEELEKNKKNKTKAEEEKKIENAEDEGSEDEGKQENSVQQRIQAAVLAERNRCKEIDALPSNVSLELKNEAKYGAKPCMAGELAMFVLKQSDPDNKAALEKLNKDAKTSQSSLVFASSATPDNISEENKKITQAKEFAAQRKARRNSGRAE